MKSKIFTFLFYFFSSLFIVYFLKWTAICRWAQGSQRKMRSHGGVMSCPSKTWTPNPEMVRLVYRLFYSGCEWKCIWLAFEPCGSFYSSRWSNHYRGGAHMSSPHQSGPWWSVHRSKAQLSSPHDERASGAEGPTSGVWCKNFIQPAETESFFF